MLAYRERSCLSTQPPTNSADLWYDEYYKDYYRYNSERIHNDTNRTPTTNSSDHKIRIKVSCNDAAPIHHGGRIDSNNCSDLESVSGASVSIVEIGDATSEVASDTFETDNSNPFDSYVQTKNAQLIDDYHVSYDEKAIDVPEEFERKAYALAGHGDSSPFVRNIQRSLDVRYV